MHRDLLYGFPVRVFMCLLSDLFCCLGFSGVHFFAVWAGAVLFLLFGRGRGPSPNSKKKHAPAQIEKKTFRACFCFSVWAGGRVHFFAVWVEGVFFLLFGLRGGGGGGVCFCCLGGRCLLFCYLGACLFFAVWVGVHVFFLLFGRGACFLAVWAGDGSSLTYRSAWLIFKGPNNKKKKKKKRVPWIPMRSHCLASHGRVKHDLRSSMLNPKS